jgi:thiosulfate/3-mercaptopyruvate sulfurtransferase
VLSPFINVNEAVDAVGSDDVAFIDCRFSLEAPERGVSEYMDRHVPGAVYAHLERDLSGEVRGGITGRHPIPDESRLRATFSAWGVGSDVSVIAYDDGPDIFASRLWWLMRWMGHVRTRVLSGGWAAWLAAGGPVKSGVESRARVPFVGSVDPSVLATAIDVNAIVESGQGCLIDARLPPRFSGHDEPIDSVAGHIPGALNWPYDQLIEESGQVEPERVRLQCRDLLGRSPRPADIAYCGSGVTAAFSILAMTNAGFQAPRLYVGSWSEWITDPTRPICTSEP